MVSGNLCHESKVVKSISDYGTLVNTKIRIMSKIRLNIRQDLKFKKIKHPFKIKISETISKKRKK
jgi:hypothetical protein